MNSHRFLSNCDRHPDEKVTGFCASCLRERLAGLDNANGRRSSTSSASSSTAALKTIFFRPLNGVNGRPSPHQRQNGHNRSAAMAAFRPELRRSKSLAGGPKAAAAVEPHRKSCDVRVRSTLSSLFHQEDRDRIVDGGQRLLLSSSTAAATGVFAAGEIEVEADSVVRLETSKDELEDVRPMKDHIDLDSYSQSKKIPSRDIKEFAGSFWLAASIFSKKLQKWRRKHKPNKSSAEDGGVKKRSALRLGEKTPISSRRFRDTQSEVALDAFGRRSCDIAPRFSLDAGRVSFDDQRCSMDEPRASWDGCLINSGRSLPSRFPAKLAAVEDAVQRSDSLIPVEEDTKTPGCSAHTRDYYSDSSGRRRRSLDRSSSSRRHSLVLCDAKSAPNSNLPELFHWTKLERESKIWGSNSLREDCSGSFDSTFRDPVNIPPVKKSRLWSILGLIHRHNGNRAGEPQVMERSFSETWPELRVTGTTIQRSSSSVSARRHFSTNGGISSSLKSGLETTCPKTKKKKKKNHKEIVLDKSRSARYSPSHFDNGLLKFYLTPTRGSWRSGLLTKSKFSSPRSFTSSILRLY